MFAPIPVVSHDQPAILVTANGVSERRRRSFGRAAVTIEIHRPARIPFPVAHLHTILELPNLELVPREDLAREAPWLAAQETRIIGRIERERLEGRGCQSGS
jgi:hypothetical protein